MDRTSWCLQENMTPKSWILWVLLQGLLWSPSVGKKCDLKQCLTKNSRIFLIADKFNSFHVVRETSCIVHMKEKDHLGGLKDVWPQMMTSGSSHLLCLSDWHMTRGLVAFVVHGRNCCSTLSNITDTNNFFHRTHDETCQVRRISTNDSCPKSHFDEHFCRDRNIYQHYVINVTATSYSCVDCMEPWKTPQNVENLIVSNEEGPLEADEAGEIMENMTSYASSLTESTVAFNGGDGVKGALMLVEEEEEKYLEDVSFGYSNPEDKLSIGSGPDSLSEALRLIFVPKQALEKAISGKVKDPFVAVMIFSNMGSDEKNSTILANEVIAVELGTKIANLTDNIEISFKNTDYSGTPSCQSWDGEGKRPNWSDEGCWTVLNGTTITCRCSHLTFFAILLIPLNQTISSSDLSHLTTITQVGCGLSVFFLSIILFMHFVLRKTKATDATKILTHLVSAMLLLNLTFLINNYVAKLKSSVGCKIMASLMHYFMLATFTWFAAQAFHLCLQMYTRGTVAIHRYILKVSITSWVMPGVIVVILLILVKYGEIVIHTDNAAKDVTMCWITDGNVHYIVNIGYYAVVFFFTFTTFTLMMSWLCLLKKTKAENKDGRKNSISITTIMGLCCMLGLTWGFGFFAHDDLLIPSAYIFTVLNSFQGFFLFIYYYNSTNPSAADTTTSGEKTSEASRTTTIGTDELRHENPYADLPKTTPAESTTEEQ